MQERGALWTREHDGRCYPMNNLGALSAGQGFRRDSSQQTLLDTVNGRHWAAASSRVHDWYMAQAGRGPIINTNTVTCCPGRTGSFRLSSVSGQADGRDDFGSHNIHDADCSSLPIVPIVVVVRGPRA